MGKTLGALFAAIVMAGGLTAVTTGGAQADPYTGTIDTTCRADNLNNPRVGNPARAKFRVGTDGNGRARGKVTFTYKRRSNGVIEGRYTRDYVGSRWDRYAFRGLPRGKYVVRVLFNSQPRNSAYQNCRDRFWQRVRPRR